MNGVHIRNRGQDAQKMVRSHAVKPRDADKALVIDRFCAVLVLQWFGWGGGSPADSSPRAINSPAC